MSKFDEAIDKYSAEVKRLNLDISHDFLVSVAKSLGPSIYNANSELVSSTSQDELGTVRKNFLIGKLGLKEDPELDQAIKEVIEKLGSANRKKYRTLFYALLIKRFNKEALYI
ncbi:hypothetical conserved protein [Candidatus Nitrosoglobus terrae]|uniref:Hypothetical conserved protein n=1 Tax=Candidatus Nitrosoglobus terrae TaxID=1630141 RepID=A0A1Q2SL68_9GAMM|nr:DUF2853 family protein [Candidatus Nitrosoglobus terrae]BAW79896.1 hypothetical conserved protein [Candidatus Nitrosoglobus terrae]